MPFMRAVASGAAAKALITLASVLVLTGMLVNTAAHAAGRRSLVLTSLDLQTSLRGPRAVSIGRLRAALIEHLELMGETVKAMDNAPGSRRCSTRDCQMALAQERQADILYGDIEQTSESTYDLTLWLWKFDNNTGAPITEYPLGTKETCSSCDEAKLTQKLIELAGSFSEQKLEPSERAERNTPANSEMLAGSFYRRDGSRWQRLSSKKKVGAAVLATISTISLISAVALTAVQGMGPTLVKPEGDALEGAYVALQVNLTPFFGAAYGISAATGAGLLAVLLW